MLQDLSLEKVTAYLVTYGINLLAAVVIFFVGKWVAGMVAGLIERLMLRGHIEKTLARFIKNMAYVGFMVFVVIAALNKLGIETTSMVAVIGAAGLAVGLALQGSLANFAAGVLLIIFKPFKAGDFIQAGGETGTVEEIQIFNTVLNSPDNRRVIIPNSKVTGDNITNFTGIDKRRIDLVFGISYKDDMKKAKEVLMKVVLSNPKVLKDPAPLVAVSELAESSVNLVCRPWVNPADYWDVYFTTVEQGKTELEKNGIAIPFPQRDVHLYNTGS